MIENTSSQKEKMILVNNAGITKRQFDDENENLKISMVIATNLKGTFATQCQVVSEIYD